MTEYDAPHRTATQVLEDDLTRALRNMARDWPAMIRPGETQAPGQATASGTTLEDHATSDADQRRIDRILSLRRYVQDVLNGWCRVVIEDRGTEHGIPLGYNVPGMIGFMTTHAQWMSGHEAATDCRDEITDLSKRCHLVVDPPRRETMSIGRCPLEVPGEADVLGVCGGDVRVRLAPDERDGEAWASCHSCGEVAVATWWESRMFGDPELRRWLTDADVVTLIHTIYGDVIKPNTVRQWVKREVLVPSPHVTQDSRRLFDRDAVIYAYELHKRRASMSRA